MNLTCGPAWGRAFAALLLATLLGLTGCAAVPGSGATERDPWERMNRKVFAFNEAVDEVAIKPAAMVYQGVVPGVVRTGVSNVFGNVNDVWTAGNLLLQAKPRQALQMGMRAVVNTSFGLLGLLDVAEEAGLERFTTEDFGQTLGYWGIKTGPYIVLPLLGPSNLRETAALAADIKDSAASVLWHEPRDRNAATVLQLLDTRVRLLNAGRVLDEIALDKYVLLRDAYLARRRSLVYDGDPPEDDTAPPPFRGQAR